MGLQRASLGRYPHNYEVSPTQSSSPGLKLGVSRYARRPLPLMINSRIWYHSIFRNMQYHRGGGGIITGGEYSSLASIPIEVVLPVLPCLTLVSMRTVCVTRHSGSGGDLG